MVQETDVRRAWEQLCLYAHHVRGETGMPGIAMALVWRPPEGGPPLVQCAALGVRKQGEPARVDADTVFPLASLSKPISSTLMTRLVHDKVLDWDEPVTQLNLQIPPTFASLFAHRSGLPDHAGDLLEDLGFTREEVLGRLHLLRLERTRAYAYTNFGLTAAAVAAAQRVPGRSWEDLAQALLYAPLGMTSTSSRHADFKARANRTWAHRRKPDGTWFHDVQPHPQAQSPAGGVTSSAKDLTRWMRLQLGDVGFEGFDARFTELLRRTHQGYEGGGYGLGWSVNRHAPQPGELGTRSLSPDGELVTLSHSGAFLLGASTCVNLLPEDRLGIAVLTNGEPIGVPEALCKAFLLLVNTPALSAQVLQTRTQPHPRRPDRLATLLEIAGDYVHAATQPRPRCRDEADPSRAIDPRAAFWGRYESPFHGSAEFEVAQGQAVMMLGPKARRERFLLRPTRQENVFVYDSRGENGTKNNRVEFDREGPDGRWRVTLWNFFAQYPRTLEKKGNTYCTVEGVIRVWSVTAKKPAQVRLTACRQGVAGIRQGPSMSAVPGVNDFLSDGFPVSEGDMLGFAIDEEVYWQQSTDDFSVEVTIDREGTYTRVEEWLGPM